MFTYLEKVGDFVTGQKGAWAFLFCVFLGALSALAYPPYPLVPFFFISIALVMLILSKADTARRAFKMGFCFGIGQFALGLYWIGNSFFAQSDVPVFLAPVAVILLVLYLSVFPGFAFLLTYTLWHNNWPQRALAFAALYTGFEFLRGWQYVFSGFPWNPTALIWWPSTAIMQNLSFLGTAGMGLLTIFSAALFASLFDRKTRQGTRAALCTLSFVLIGLGFIFGRERLADDSTVYHEKTVLRLVQADIPQTKKWDPAFIRENLEKYLRMSETPSGPEGPVTAVIWPETAMPYDLENETTRKFLMNRLPGRILITGAVRQVLEPTPELNNSIYFLGPDGAEEARYDKSHLVPFGEYLPWRNILGVIGLDTLVPGSMDFTPGEGVKTLAIPGLPKVSPLVCYEIIFPGRVALKTDPPQWILNLTNDAWFGKSAGPHQHFEMARMRAIEEGVPVVRVAGTGISAVIDPYGRVLSQLGLGRQGVIDTRLPKRISGRTLFSKFSPWLVLILGFSFLFAGVGPGPRGQVKKGADQ